MSLNEGKSEKKIKREENCGRRVREKRENGKKVRHANRKGKRESERDRKKNRMMAPNTVNKKKRSEFISRYINIHFNFIAFT